MHAHTDAESTTPRLHDERIEAVTAVLLEAGAASVLDLGCGTGDLLLPLSREPSIRRIVGVDRSSEALGIAAERLQASPPAPETRVELRHASYLDPGPDWCGFDAAVLLETIEHIAPDRLSTVERAVFSLCRPARVVITTPNLEWNGLLGVPQGGYRHPDHRFEWPRARFAAWARGLAARTGYRVSLRGIGTLHPTLGCPTQMAVFDRQGDAGE